MDLVADLIDKLQDVQLVEPTDVGVLIEIIDLIAALAAQPGRETGLTEPVREVYY